MMMLSALLIHSQSLISLTRSLNLTSKKSHPRLKNNRENIGNVDFRVGGRGGDSNSRWTFVHAAFQVRCLQPLEPLLRLARKECVLYSFLCDCYLNHSLKFFGHPSKNNNARGAPQFAHLSTKSQTGSGPIGQRIIAVHNPQSAIHKTAIRTGLIRVRTAKARSSTPMSKSRVTIVSGLFIPTASKYLNHDSLP